MYQPEHIFDPERDVRSSLTAEQRRWVREAAQVLQPAVAEGHCGSLNELAIRYCTHHTLLGTTLVGVTSAEQLLANAEACRRGPLPEEVLLLVEQATQRYIALSGTEDIFLHY